MASLRPALLTCNTQPCYCGLKGYCTRIYTNWKYINTFLFSLSALFLVSEGGLTQPQTTHWPAYMSKLECLALAVILQMLVTSHPTLSLPVFACLTSYISEPVEFAAASSPSKVGGPSQLPHLPFSEMGLSAPLHYFWFNLPHWLLFSAHSWWR